MLFKKEKHIDSKYEYLSKYGDVVLKSFWTPAKYQKNIEKQDVPQILYKMSPEDSEAAKRTVLAISLVEDKVKTFWSFLVQDLPQTVIGETGAIFGCNEVIHAQSYRFLITALGLSEMFDKINDIPAMNGRVEYLTKHLKTNSNISREKQVLKKLVLFTILVERISLFSQFYILMSYNFRNKGLKTINSLQSTTALEELNHYQFGLELVNIIKSENPELWDQDLKEQVVIDINKAYFAELNLLDWIFEKGCPDHLSKKELINFINYNFNQVGKDLNLEDYINFAFDEEYYFQRNAWMLQSLQPKEPDFFVNPVGGYSSTDEEVDLESLDKIFI